MSWQKRNSGFSCLSFHIQKSIEEIRIFYLSWFSWMELLSTCQNIIFRDTRLVNIDFIYRFYLSNSNVKVSVLFLFVHACKNILSTEWAPLILLFLLTTPFSQCSKFCWIDTNCNIVTSIPRLFAHDNYWTQLQSFLSSLSSVVNARNVTLHY